VSGKILTDVMIISGRYDKEIPYGYKGFAAKLPMAIDYVNCKGKFIYFQMLTNDFQRKVIDGSGQATLPIINKSKWETLLMKIPPLKIQLDIVGRLESLRFVTDNHKNSQLKKIQQLLLLKNSILKKAFNGELVKE
jgi:restriction endonuclease S subunit